MTQSVSAGVAQPSTFALPPSELNAFLLAEVATQTNGLSLTVLSLLARMGRDPWAEARRLDELPIETAIVSMTAAIAASPVCIAPECDPKAIAMRLVARLPSQSPSSWAGAARADAIAHLPPPLALLILWVSIGAVLFAALIRT
jgi:hypothetical protein